MNFARLESRTAAAITHNVFLSLTQFERHFFVVFSVISPLYATKIRWLQGRLDSLVGLELTSARGP